MDDAVQDDVRERGTADQVKPSFDRDLADDQRGITTVSFFDDLQQIASLFRTGRFEALVNKGSHREPQRQKGPPF